MVRLSVPGTDWEREEREQPKEADFLATQTMEGWSIAVKLLAAPRINTKWLDKSLYLAFPGENRERPRAWFLIPHDELVALATEHTDWTTSASWAKGAYSGTPPRLITALHDGGYCIGQAIAEQ